MADTTVNALLAAAKCYQCAGVNPQLLKLGLLKQIALSLDDMADTSVNALLEAAKCYNCSGVNLLLLELGLLKVILDAGGMGGGSGGVLCGVLDPPVADPGIDCCLYYNTATGGMWQWNDGTGAWDETL